MSQANFYAKAPAVLEMNNVAEGLKAIADENPTMRARLNIPQVIKSLERSLDALAGLGTARALLGDEESQPGKFSLLATAIEAAVSKRAVTQPASTVRADRPTIQNIPAPTPAKPTPAKLQSVAVSVFGLGTVATATQRAQNDSERNAAIESLFTDRGIKVAGVTKSELPAHLRQMTIPASDAQRKQWQTETDALLK